ncbi:hypothetical protein H8709_01260 [Oscillospiraceae bacterium NSJ-54]|uniref:Uncharacterized protein n=1 Tax=Zongyangia hominis TaxID=2763677 RepID=A0A926I600_9FIRM|nr:hypothetical protein [Zongyangia hominis]
MEIASFNAKEKQVHLSFLTEKNHKKSVLSPPFPGPKKQGRFLERPCAYVVKLISRG